MQYQKTIDIGPYIYIYTVSVNNFDRIILSTPFYSNNITKYDHATDVCSIKKLPNGNDHAVFKVN